MTYPLRRFGVVYPTHGKPEDFLGFARHVEELGFAHLWVVEDCFRTGGFTLAASALAANPRLNVGVGLLPAPVRNPALAAMEIATLAGAYPGRFTATFGHGVRSWMEQIGAAPQHRLLALEETVRAVSALLGGGPITMAGEQVILNGVELEIVPGILPDLLIGSTGPKGLDLAGAIGDGMLLPEGCGPEFIDWAVARAHEGAVAAGKPRDASRCVVYAWVSLDPAADAAVARLAPALTKWATSEHYPIPQQLAGLPVVPREATPPSTIDPAELARRVAICGDRSTCAAAAERFFAAGADELLLVPQGPDVPGQLERFVAEVLPLLDPGDLRTDGAPAPG